MNVFVGSRRFVPSLRDTVDVACTPGTTANNHVERNTNRSWRLTTPLNPNGVRLSQSLSPWGDRPLRSKTGVAPACG